MYYCICVIKFTCKWNGALSLRLVRDTNHEYEIITTSLFQKLVGRRWNAGFVHNGRKGVTWQPQWKWNKDEVENCQLLQQVYSHKKLLELTMQCNTFSLNLRYLQLMQYMEAVSDVTNREAYIINRISIDPLRIHLILFQSWS